MDLISGIFIVVIAGIFYVSAIARINSLQESIDYLRKEINESNKNLDKILKMQAAIGEDLKDTGSAVYAIYNNVELMSSMNMAAYVANTNETIRQLIKHDKFEAAQVLKNNLEKLIEDFKKMNPHCSFKVKDASEFTRDIFNDDEED